MRLVQVTIPAGKRETVLSTLDDEGIDYVLTDETSGREYTGVVTFPLPTNAVEPVLASLREVGVERDAYTVVIDAETVISRRFEQLEQQYEKETKNGERIAREELVTRANELVTGMQAYVVLTVVSSLIATAGLLLDSPAVVVGSMVIAPLIGPAMAASVGTVLDDREMFVRGVKLQLLGLALAVASAAAFALVLRYTLLIPPGIDVTTIAQVRERLRPDFLSLAVALGAGVAGVISLSTGVSSALVGVMIAVALIPPAATVGIGIAWGLPAVMAGSSVLLLVNVLSINLAALVVLWQAGYRPDNWFKLEQSRSALVERAVFLLVAIAVLSLFLGGVTYNSFQSASLEQNVRDDVGVLLNESYPRTTLVSVDLTEESTTELADADGQIFGHPREIVVTVGVPPDHAPAGLASAIDERATRTAGYDVSVRVEYVVLEETRERGSGVKRTPGDSTPAPLPA